ncbi:thioredoxin-disulfide reductase [Enterobacteriaceae endosymbiont of Neohaemonia nigricornis]|uniref:thioredoxin-disulfide reductase n=1 Tax=Enterobacteriaceae endosymbiont of Neohaemonia nigricornis TaxID=2675792 RepID=UPI001449F6ED|nr:thioredoxin-disulfide reductase [Enterobacteriaceae endosymbiont of Neohaemonia nigricornis]QJC30608.1 thioredoxin-disulfide reductase [Enterobacteriaceae endosymbiont of Neohaemonia nigricornis]
MQKKTTLIILGSGPAGYTAAIYAARANLNFILITGNNIGGQLTQTISVENWPGNYPSITGMQLMDNLYNHAIFYKTNIIKDTIIQADLKQKPFILQGETNKYICNSLIIATGSSPKYLGLSSEKKFLGKGISTCAICDGNLYRNKKVAIIGGGNSALEEAIYLSNIASEVHIIHRQTTFRADKILINKIIKLSLHKNIILHQPYIVKDILGHENFGVTKIKINQINTLSNVVIKVSGIFILIGSYPNTYLFKDQIKLDSNGYIITTNHTKTNIPGVFAAGDVTNNIYKQAIISSAAGCMASLDAQRFLQNI